MSMTYGADPKGPEWAAGSAKVSWDGARAFKDLRRTGDVPDQKPPLPLAEHAEKRAGAPADHPV